MAGRRSQNLTSPLFPGRPTDYLPPTTAAARTATEGAAKGDISQSERDWAFVRSELRKGADPATLAAAHAARFPLYCLYRITIPIVSLL